jgi:CBS domain-containing protein
MTAISMQQFRRELRRIRKDIGHAFGERMEENGGERGLSSPRGRGHVVPSHLTIVDVMEGGLAAVSAESSVGFALTLFIDNRISSVPVIEGDGRIVGALNEKDLMRVFYLPEAHCVAAVMTRNPVTVSIDAPLVDVVDQLMSSDFRRVLIHDNHRLVGVITRSHLMPALMEALEASTIARGSAQAPH